MDVLQTYENGQTALTQEVSFDNRLQIIEEGIRKNYLTRLSDMRIAPVQSLLPLEDDLIDNIRLYHITEMVYEKGESAIDKFTTVYNTISTYNASVFLILDSDGDKTDFYIGVRNNEQDERLKRSTVTLGDTLQNTLIGHFPGIKIQNEDRARIARLVGKIESQHNVASVSVSASNKSESEQRANDFVQGLEKLVLAMSGRQYIGILIAENQPHQTVSELRSSYQELYTKLSPYQNVQMSYSTSESTSSSKSFAEMNNKQKAAMLGGAVISVAGAVGGGIAGLHVKNVGITGGAMIGGQIAGQLNGFINSLAPTEQITKGTSSTKSTTLENKSVTSLLKMIDDALVRLDTFDSYGMWNVAGYFISDDMSAAEIAASNYRSLMSGEKSGREVSAINSWRSDNPENNGNFSDLTLYLSRFAHPQFCYGYNGDYAVLTNAATAISGKELGLHLGLPRATVPGLPVIMHAEFGKEVYSYQLFKKNQTRRPEDWMTLGRVFDLGQITDKPVELDNKSLNMHTFITGSTGSGKSNTVYQMLAELHQDKIPFLVVEPAKGEYKDVFGNWPDVNVYSTNPNVSELVNINPFMFPRSIHLLEHVDGLVEIFSVCWPMYDAMSAFFKDAILKSYESVGWDLGSSTFEGDALQYPDFGTLCEQLAELIEHSDYADEVKSNYRGALITRVRSLTVGLNKFIFTAEQTPYSKLFDENCILDISRVKSTETKALIMGLMVYILNEYRVDQKSGNNKGLEHVTVLEEAHNLLKNTTTGNSSELTGKSVEMLTQTIAEIRTYGEGFIIVDQSPSSVDIAAIKNTNTKIVLRTPEANDREAVGRSMGLTEDQVNEIAKLPSGVAVVYQNNWVSPVLTMVNKANVTESTYENPHRTVIRPLRSARTVILRMIMQPWLPGKMTTEKTLQESLKVLDIEQTTKGRIRTLIGDYVLFSGHLVWKERELPELQRLVQAVLGYSDKDFASFTAPEDLMKDVQQRVKGMTADEIRTVCYMLTLGGDTSDI